MSLESMQALFCVKKSGRNVQMHCFYIFFANLAEILTQRPQSWQVQRQKEQGERVHNVDL